jgi:hypothetical protein
MLRQYAVRGVVAAALVAAAVSAVQKAQAVAWEIAQSYEYSGVGTVAADPQPAPRRAVAVAPRAGTLHTVDISDRRVTAAMPAVRCNSRLHSRSAGALTVVP